MSKVSDQDKIDKFNIFQVYTRIPNLLIYILWGRNNYESEKDRNYIKDHGINFSKLNDINTLHETVEKLSDDQYLKDVDFTTCYDNTVKNEKLNVNVIIQWVLSLLNTNERPIKFPNTNYKSNFDICTFLMEKKLEDPCITDEVKQKIRDNPLTLKFYKRNDIKKIKSEISKIDVFEDEIDNFSEIFDAIKGGGLFFEKPDEGNTKCYDFWTDVQKQITDYKNEHEISHDEAYKIIRKRMSLEELQKILECKNKEDYDEDDKDDLNELDTKTAQSLSEYPDIEEHTTRGVVASSGQVENDFDNKCEALIKSGIFECNFKKLIRNDKLIKKINLYIQLFELINDQENIDKLILLLEKYNEQKKEILSSICGEFKVNGELNELGKCIYNFYAIGKKPKKTESVSKKEPEPHPNPVREPRLTFEELKRWQITELQPKYKDYIDDIEYNDNNKIINATIKVESIIYPRAKTLSILNIPDPRFRDVQKDSNSCGRRALNNLIGNNFFLKGNKGDTFNLGWNGQTNNNLNLAALEHICTAFSMNDTTKKSDLGKEFYSFEFIGKALKVSGFFIKELVSSSIEYRINFIEECSKKNSIKGFILSNSGHWLCIRKEKNNWYFINSFEEDKQVIYSDVPINGNALYYRIYDYFPYMECIIAVFNDMEKIMWNNEEQITDCYQDNKDFIYDLLQIIRPFEPTYMIKYYNWNKPLDTDFNKILDEIIENLDANTQFIIDDRIKTNYLRKWIMFLFTEDGCNRYKLKSENYKELLFNTKKNDPIIQHISLSQDVKSAFNRLEEIRNINESYDGVRKSLNYYKTNPHMIAEEKIKYDQLKELEERLLTKKKTLSPEDHSFNSKFSIIPLEYRETLKEYLDSDNILNDNGQNILNIIKKDQYTIFNMHDLQGGSINNKYYPKYLKYKNKYLELSKLKKSKY